MTSGRLFMVINTGEQLRFSPFDVYIKFLSFYLTLAIQQSRFGHSY